MSGDLTTVKARYEQVIQMAHFAIEPKISGARHEFRIEDHDIVLAFPPLPAEDAPPNFAQQNPFQLSSKIFMWNAAREPMGIDVGSVKVCIEGLHFSIPSVAAVHPAINMCLFNEQQKEELNKQSDDFYFLAERAVNYWLRVVWWKTGFHMITRLSGIAQGGFDGGALVNADAGTRFYTPRVGRTIMFPAQPIMQAFMWSEIDSALKAGQEPPIWHDYLTSAHQRMASGDRLAAMLDLAVASEARIRTFLESQLPAGVSKGFRRAARRQNMSDVLTHWRDFGLPDFPDLACLKTLFQIRNGIMHSGREERANVQFFKSTASVVAALLMAI